MLAPHPEEQIILLIHDLHHSSIEETSLWSCVTLPNISGYASKPIGRTKPFLTRALLLDLHLVQ